MSSKALTLLRNPALLLAVALPAIAVVASFATLGLTLLHPESELPEQYHWEGFQLDRDFSRGMRAGKLGVSASVTGLREGGTCALRLSTHGQAPETLHLMLAHATMPSLDRKIEFRRQTTEPRGARYVGQCPAMPSANWRIELMDADGNWALRTTHRGELDGLTFDAGVPAPPTAAASAPLASGQLAH